MNRKIKCSLKSIYRWYIVGILVEFMVSILIAIIPMSLRGASICVFFCLLILGGYGFWYAYQTRQIPEFFKFEDDKVTISYSNKGSFRLKTFKGPAAACTMRLVGKDWHILNDNNLVAVVKLGMLDEEEIEFLKSMFKVE